MVALGTLVGAWKVTMTGAWFLDSLEDTVFGAATIEWLDDAFLVFRWTMEDVEGSWSTFVIGRSDAREQYAALYADYRGVNRVFDMDFEDGDWRMARRDPDFYQRIVATVGPDLILARAEASEDEGRTWRKDFDLLFERQAAGP
jgi:hypothetical protein